MSRRTRQQQQAQRQRAQCWQNSRRSAHERAGRGRRFLLRGAVTSGSSRRAAGWPTCKSCPPQQPQAAGARLSAAAAADGLPCCRFISQPTKKGDLFCRHVFSKPFSTRPVPIYVAPDTWFLCAEQAYTSDGTNCAAGPCKACCRPSCHPLPWCGSTPVQIPCNLLVCCPTTAWLQTAFFTAKEKGMPLSECS